ncbi:S24 family peptidase [Acidovorax sp. CF316]|uniref:S24 family peptidase n=1 Tax=Acidovorax sp. CF316 TaxID=1144317 RepID=UPI0005575464|nr:S24 family peptidase [Acidovorax sp. CF316]
MNDRARHDSLQRLLTAAEKTGIKGPSALAKALNESDQTITNWGRRGVSKSGAMNAERLLGVSSNWVISGEGAAVIGEPSPRLPTPPPGPIPAPGEQVVHVPLLANAGVMGDGADVLHDDVVIGYISLSREWVTRRLKITRHEDLRFIHGYGDSMSDTFEDGDILLVNSGARDPSQADGVYVLEAGHRVFIKRVTERFDGSFEVSSDNPKVKMVDILDGNSQIEVRGRVVWVWKGKKL